MQERPTQTDFYRLGAGAALVGGVIGIVFNLLHPRTGDALGNTRAELTLVAESDIWRLDHLMLGLAVALIFVGVIALALSMTATPGDAWARAWLIFSAVSSAVLFVLLALDGTAIKSLADAWAGSGNDPGLFRAANVLVEINGALLGASIALSFGISPLLFGMAVWASGSYPKAVAQASFGAGIVGLFTAAWFAFDGFNGVALNILFPIASLLYTVAVMWAAWQLWNNYADVTTVGTSTKTTVTRTETPVVPGL